MIYTHYIVIYSKIYYNMYVKIIPYTTERGNTSHNILLDANEHYEQWVDIPASSLLNLNRYPDQQCKFLSEKLAKTYCRPFTPDQILIASGSIEIIDLLMYSIKPKQLIVNFPCYDVYMSRASVHGIQSKAIPFKDDGQPDADYILSLNNTNDLLILINPNNPTGHLVNSKVIEKIINNFKGTIVIDEAYIEFSGLHKSFQNLIFRSSRVIVLRTFSKAWGLAGVRLGYALSSPAIINKLKQYKNSYSVNSIAIAAGLSALDKIDILNKNVSYILQEKSRLIRDLKHHGIKVYDTSANFVLIDIKNPIIVANMLKDNGVIVRPRQVLNDKSVLRVTVGSKFDNIHLLSVLKELV